MASKRNNEQTDELLASAEILAAGRTLGMTDDETIATKRATIRRNIEERRAERASREGNRAAAEAFLAQDDANFRAKGKLTEFERQLALGSKVEADIDDEGWAFGEDPVWERDSKGNKLEKKPRRPQDDDQFQGDLRDPAVREMMVRNDVLGPDFLTPEEVVQQNEGRGRKQVGIGGMRDALRRLEMAKEQYGFAAFGAEGPEMERLYKALKDDLGDGQQISRDKREAAVLADVDAKRRRGEVSDAEIEKAVDQVVRNAAYDRRERSAAAPVGFRRDPAVPAADPNIFYDKRGKLRGMERDAGDVTIKAHPGVKGVDLAADIRDQLLVRREGGRAMAPEFRRMKNDAKAAREASEIANRGGGLPRQLADEDIGNIAEIRNLGVAGGAGHGVLEPGNYQVVTNVNPSEFGRAIPLIGKDGMPIAHFERVGDQLLQLGNDVNSPDSANALNAPKATPMQEWVVANQPPFGKNNVFGEPQVEINDLMQMVGDRVRGLRGFDFEGVGNPRNFQEFDQMINAVAARGKKRGKQFFRFDQEQNKNIAVPNPGVDEVLNALRIPQGEREKIAWALRQQQLVNQPVNFPGDAEPRLINAADKERFARREERPLAQGSREGVVMNAAEMRADGGTPIDMVKNERVGRGKNAKGVRAALAGINDEGVMNALNEQGQLFDVADKDVRIKGELVQRKGQKVLLPEAARVIAGAQQARNDAQMPMQAAIKGEGVQRARFIRGEDRKLSPEALVEKFGEENARKALQVEMRHERAKRAQNAVAIDPGAELQRRKDAAIAAQADRARINAEDAEIGRIFEQMRFGRKFDAPDSFEGDEVAKVNSAGEQINPPKRVPGAKRGEVLRVPPRSAFVGDDSPAARAPGRIVNGERVEQPGRPNFRRPVQQLQQAPVARSIAPDPGVGTGNQASPMIDAGGGGVKPPTRTAVAGGPMPDDMRNQLFSLPGPYEKKLMGEPDGPSSAADDAIRRVREMGSRAGNKAKDFATNPKYQRNRRIGYGIGGGLGALATVLNLSGNEEEEANR